MTICIAAITGKGQIVMASDRMVTLQIPSIEYEQNMSKTLEVTKSCVIAGAGAALNFSIVYKKLKKKLEQEQTEVTIRRIAELCKKSFVEARKDQMEEVFLSRHGISFQSFLDKNKTLNEQFVATINTQMNSFKFGISILIAGVDKEGAHIFTIDDPGVMLPYDSVGNCSIGSGQLHATSSFIASDYDPEMDLNHIITMTYEAKRKSEVAAGVGKETDLFVITDCTKKLSNKEMLELKEIYDSKITGIKKIESDLEERISKLNI